MRGSSLVIGWQRWSRPSRTSVNPDPLTMVATLGEHGSDAKKVHFHEIHLVLMYRVSWWIPFRYLHIYIVWNFVFSCVHCNASVIEETMVGRRINLVVSAKY